MTSVLGWVDFGQQHRQDMDRLLDAFRDASTVDELGIGTIRDTFSELLFPGTSTLHTRARYLVFVAWQVSTVAARRRHLERALVELRAEEVRLIEALIAGDPDAGVIGRTARAALKRMPSEVYWGALGRYQIRRCEDGPQQHLRAVTAEPLLPAEEEDESTRPHRDPHFAQLPGRWDDLYGREATFDLTPDEADFLAERILATCDGTYLAWLVRNRTPGETAYAWDEELTDGLDHEPARVLAHARRLHQLFLGAPLLYNLMLARLEDREDLVEEFEDRLLSWAAAEEQAVCAAQWERDDFWRCVLDGGRRVNAGTRDFLNRWVALVREDPAGVWRRPEAEQLVELRERRLKKSRSRFLGSEARSDLEFGYGVGGLHYRWGNARTLVNDIRRGQGLEHA